MSLKKAKRYKLKAWAGVFAALALAAAGVFVLPKFISADGVLIWTQVSNPSDKSDSAYDVAVDSTGIYVVGYDRSAISVQPDDHQWRMEKRNLSDGSVIWTQTSNPTTSYYIESAYGTAVDSSGVYVVGFDRGPATGAEQWRMEKRNLTTGDLIWSQVSNRTYELSYETERAYGAAVDSSGVYVVGADNGAVWGVNNYQWRIEKRDLTTGAFITSFGTGGIVTSNPSNGNDAAYDIAIDSSGVYVVGYQSGGAYWRTEKRNLTTGALIWSQVWSLQPPVSDRNYAYAVAVDSSGVYIVGIDRSPGSGDTQWRMEKRNLTTGDLIWSQVNNLSSVYDYAQDVAVDSTGIYVVGYDYSPGNYQWRIDKRDPATGDLIWYQVSNPSNYQDFAEGVAVDSSGGIYVVGADRSPGATYQWRIEKRRTAAPVTAPTVATQIASSVGDLSAVLNGLVNPNNGSTTSWFRYDTANPGSCNDTFGTRAPSSGGTSLGSGSTNVPFAQTVGGLNSTTTYYFCAIAENSAGKSYGSVLSFATAAPGAISSYGVTREGCELKNWGWGSEVTGWVSFNSTNNYGGKTPGANYGATMTNFCQNIAPNAPSGLSVTDTSSANWSFNCVSPLQPTFSWIFTDPNTDDSQYAYQIQVDDNSDYSSPEYDSGSVTSTALTTSVPAGRLSYNTTYNWRVKTWDNRKTPLASPWATGTPFATTAHSWPSPDFTFLPNLPSVGQDTLFRRDQDSNGDTFGTRCFDINNNSVACGNYYWTMEDSSPTMSNTASSSIPVIVSFNSIGKKEITLKATDAEGFYCFKQRSTGTVTLPLPIFKEVLPR